MRRRTILAIGTVAAAFACGEIDVRHSAFDASVQGADASSQGSPDASDSHPDAAVGVDAGPCSDSCPMATGVSWQCRQRFMYGVNWAWHSFGGDFGGIAAWNQPGVAANSATISDEMAQMKAAGASTIRWWMFPRFWTESITFGADDAPSGVGGTLVADVQEALRLADQHDVYLMLTLFSFDSFTPTMVESGIRTPGIQPIALDAAKRQKLLDNLVRPIAQAVEASPYKARVVAWDVINEPEWAMTGANAYGGEDFGPQAGLDTLTHSQMETFVNAVADVLHANNGAKVTVGSAAIKWGTAWTHSHIDFYQLHYYDWVYEWFPYTSATLQSVGLTDKPVVMGEFPTGGLTAVGGNPARTAAQLSQDLWDHGYGGALSWAFSDTSFPWNPALLKAFADQHPCETHY